MAAPRKIKDGFIQLPDGRVLPEDWQIDGVPVTEIAAQQEASGEYETKTVRGGEIRQEDQKSASESGINQTGNRESGIRVSTPDSEVSSTLTSGATRSSKENAGSNTPRKNSDAEVNEKATPSSDGGEKSKAESDPINGGYKPGGLGGEFSFRTPAQVMARVRQGQDYLAEPTRKAMENARQTGSQVNAVRAEREAQLKEGGVDPARAKVLANMEAQNLLRASYGLPQFKESDIVTGPDGKPTLSTSSRDQRIFNEQRGAANYYGEVPTPMKNAGEKQLLGTSIKQPDGQIAFSTTKAGRQHLGTEGRARFAGIGDGFGGSGENPMDRAIVEGNSRNGIVDRAGVRATGRGTAFSAAGQFALEALDRLGAERRNEFQAGMAGRASDPNASVGVDATGQKRTAADLLKRNRMKKVMIESAATGGRLLPTANVFSR